MADSSLTTIPLFGDAEFYLPLKVADRFGFKLSHHIVDGRFWGSIQDWLIGMLGTVNAAQTALDNFTRSDAYNEVSSSKRELTRNLDYTASDGKTYQTAHGSEYLLYLLAQQLRTTKKRPQVAAVKAYLAESGVIVGEMVRDPEGTAAKLLNLPDTQTTRKQLKEIRRGTDSGYSWEESKERLSARQALKETNKRIAGVRAGFGVRTAAHHAELNGLDFRDGVLVTQDEWKRQHGIKGSASDYLSTLDLVTLIYAKEAAADKYAQRNPQTYTELVEVAESIREECERNHRILSRILPDRFLKALPDKPEQKQLKAGER